MGNLVFRRAVRRQDNNLIRGRALFQVDIIAVNLRHLHESNVDGRLAFFVFLVPWLARPLQRPARAWGRTAR